MISNTAIVERITCDVARMGRRKLKSRLLNFRGRFKLDFSEAYLESQPVDRLRHILLAAMLQRLRRN